MAKIKTEELSNIVSLQTKLQSIITDLGIIETKKHELLHAFANINEDINKSKLDLEKEYGKVNIDLETGEYTDIKDEQGN